MRTAGTSHRSHGPEPGGAVKPCVIVAEPRGLGDSPIASQIDPDAFEVVWCDQEQDVLDRVIQRRPSALVFALGAECQHDLVLLFLLRRVAPAVPLILVAAAASLETQKLIQDLRPTYYAVRPVDRAELLEAIAAAIAAHGRRDGGRAGRA